MNALTTKLPLDHCVMKDTSSKSLCIWINIWGSSLSSSVYRSRPLRKKKSHVLDFLQNWIQITMHERISSTTGLAGHRLYVLFIPWNVVIYFSFKKGSCVILILILNYVQDWTDAGCVEKMHPLDLCFVEFMTTTQFSVWWILWWTKLKIFGMFDSQVVQIHHSPRNEDRSEVTRARFMTISDGRATCIYVVGLWVNISTDSKYASMLPLPCSCITKLQYHRMAEMSLSLSIRINEKGDIVTSWLVWLPWWQMNSFITVCYFVALAYFIWTVASVWNKAVSLQWLVAVVGVRMGYRDRCLTSNQLNFYHTNGWNKEEKFNQGLLSALEENNYLDHSPKCFFCIVYHLLGTDMEQGGWGYRHYFYFR